MGTLPNSPGHPHDPRPAAAARLLAERPPERRGHFEAAWNWLYGQPTPFANLNETYLDHGDNPYNLDFKASGLSAADLLIDDATYTAWFGTTLDNHDTPAACPNIGRQVTELTTP